MDKLKDAGAANLPRGMRGDRQDRSPWERIKVLLVQTSTYTKFRVKLLRTKDKEKSLESSKREKRPYLIEKQLK